MPGEGAERWPRVPALPGQAHAVPPRSPLTRPPVVSTERTPWRRGVRPAGAAAASRTCWGTLRRLSAAPCAASTRLRPAAARRMWPWRPAPLLPAKRAPPRSTSRSRAPSQLTALRGRCRAKTGCWCERACPPGCARAGGGCGLSAHGWGHARTALTSPAPGRREAVG